MSDFTVKDLRREIEGLSDDTIVTFAGGLDFYRTRTYEIKNGKEGVFFEFNQAEAYMSPEFKKEHPHVQVVFIKSPDSDSFITSQNVAV